MRRLIGLAMVLAVLGACAGQAAPRADSEAGARPPAGAPPPAERGAAPAATASAPPALERVTLLYPSQGGNHAALWMAEDYGLFQKHGLDLDLQFIEGSPIVMQAMAAGNGDLAHVGTSASISAAFRGLDTVLVGTIQPRLIFALWGNGFTRTADLPGKRIATGRVNSDPDFALRVMLNRLALRYNEDLDVVHVDAGGDAARVAAVEANAADGLVIAAGLSSRLTKLGYTSLMDLSAENIPYEAATIVTTRHYAASKPRVVSGFLRAVTEGIALAKHERAATIEVYRQHARLDDMDTLNEWYETYVERVYPMVPYVSEAGVRTVLDLLALTEPQAATAKPEDYIDNSFMREIEASGFVQQLYAR
ncbi:MAG TPA: ABC transporter substrate-binding protein [Chloroflexota bacterium]|nr:ABC transporter substrate-binding protein [Chloroflexota bacterium]